MSASIKKKISLNDYKPQNSAVDNLPKKKDQKSKNLQTITSKGNEVNTSTHYSAPASVHFEQEVSHPIQEQKKIHKTTIYLSDKSKRQFDEIYAKRILASRETDKAELLREALELLYEREYSK